MEKLREGGYMLTSICKFVGISRQSYYKRMRRIKVKNDLYNALEKVVIKNRKIKSRVGLRTVYAKEKMSTLLGINQFEQEMSVRGFALKPYKSYKKTTDSRGLYYIFDNIIEGKEVNNENLVIVGDITYYENETGLYYVFQFTDYYTLEIKGLVGSRNMEGINAEKCLRQVFRYNNRSAYNSELIIHTDAGGQYRSHKFQHMLRKSQIRPSHAKNCFENGLGERVNGIVKNEYLIDYNIRSENHLKKVLKKIKSEANGLWPSKTLGYKTPKEYAKWIRQSNEKDRPIKKVKIVQRKD